MHTKSFMAFNVATHISLDVVEYEKKGVVLMMHIIEKLMKYREPGDWMALKRYNSRQRDILY